MSQPVRPAPGTVVELAEDQYRFGTASLLCRIRQAIAHAQIDGVAWWHIAQECADGTAASHGGSREQQLYVIASAIPAPEMRRRGQV